MSIYDEAIENAKCYKVVNEILLDGKDKYRHDNYANQIIQALERAKKEHELLELYKKKEQCIVCFPLMKDSPKLQCFLRDSDDKKYMRILSQIKQLDEELK